MKKFILYIAFLLGVQIFPQTIIFEPGEFSNSSDQLIIDKEHNIYKRPYNSKIDGNYIIKRINVVPNSTNSTVEFYGKEYRAKYYIYPGTQETIYLFKIPNLGNLSLTLFREDGKIKYLYKIPNRGLFSKNPLRELPESDKELLKSRGFSEQDINYIKDDEKFTLFYTGCATFKK